MSIPNSIRDNLRFFLAEVRTQLRQLQAHLEQGELSAAKAIEARAGYALNLNNRIQQACARYASDQVSAVRSAAIIATQLDRIAELCRHCVRQRSFLDNGHSIDLSIHHPPLTKIIAAVAIIEKALLKNDTERALKVARLEHGLDAAFQKLLKQYTDKLKQQNNTEDLVTGLFIAQAIEQMGDALLIISNAIIANNIGQSLDYAGYQTLKKTANQLCDDDSHTSRIRHFAKATKVSKNDKQSSANNIELEPLAETRSGSIVSALHYQQRNSHRQKVIFKNGAHKKLKEEIDGVKAWHSLYPGIAPHIIDYTKNGDASALLIEHLHGVTFEQLAIENNSPQLTLARDALCATLFSIWDTTKTQQPIAAGFMAQMQKRLPDVFAIHPNFNYKANRIGDNQQLSLAALIQKAHTLELTLASPFSVFIHGDFNVDNILYDANTQKINFIDLHRSTHMDYVQDVSVFMVSNYRLQSLAKPIRHTINQHTLAFYAAVAQYAARNNDTTFELRLCLALARSFATSTRFILDKTLANRMFLRARYLLEQAINSNLKKPQKYQLPIHALFSE